MMTPSTNNKRSARTAAAAVFALALTAAPAADAFAPAAANRQAASTSTSLFAEKDDVTSSRRAVLQTSMGAIFAGLAGASVGPQEASASYSAYTAREQDWEARSKSGDIKVSSARDLKNQLREIVPQNNEGSKIFCPNGPSAAVSPLMENKCGDRMATASVFGRTDDIVGNSVPDFSGRKYSGGGGVGGSSLSSASTGGFPSYGDIGATAGKKNTQLLN